MNKASFLSLVRETSRISDQDAEALEQLVENFPYCQTAHLLIAKAAYDRGSMLSNQKLKKAAIYATNRQLLKKLIYTSDATVALHPLPPAETLTEKPEKADLAGADIIADAPVAAPALTGKIASPETSVEQKSEDAFTAKAGAEPDNNVKQSAEEPATETLSDNLSTASENIGNETLIPDEVILAEEVAIAETILEGTEAAGHAEALTFPEAAAEKPVETGPGLTESAAGEATEPVIPEPVILAEEVLIADTILNSEEAPGQTLAGEPEAEEGEPEDQEVSESPSPETDSAGKISEINLPVEAVLAEEVEIAETILAPSETEIIGDETASVNTELDLAESEIQRATTEIPETPAEPETIAEEPVGAGNTLAETLAETTEKLPEYHELPADFETTLQDVRDLHEFHLTGEAHPVPHKVSAMHDDLLQETLASFDQYLFKPEKETAEAPETEDLQVVYPENEIEAIYYRDSIGYWMSSSRLGESLQVKNDLTTALPFEFHPELLLEYTKTHELEKQLKPAPSVLSKQLDIIDQFLKLSPKLKAGANIKIRTEAQEDLSQKSTKINKNLASENFANILVKQGKIKKAIKIYEHLILKIPEKKAYFVAQIEKLQNQE